MATHPWREEIPDLVLEPEAEERPCPRCGRRMKICDHRFRPIERLDGPVRLVCKLLKCFGAGCVAPGKTYSPRAEALIAPPRATIDWDLFTWIGYRRFERHWSVPQLREVTLVREIASTVRIADDTTEDRRREFESLRQQCESSDNARYQAMGALMGRWMPGLFVGENLRGTPMPLDNYDLERWFKLPKQHARHTHGRAHAGTAVVVRGPTRVLALDAHREHPGPFCAKDLLPWRNANPPASQQRTLARTRIMRRARSTKARPSLLAELEARYRGSG